MNRYFIKPLFWNSGDYQKPTGAKAASGHPHEYGFGHEEWNNNPGNRIRLDGVWHRVFHITQLNPASEIGAEDNVVVLFITSHSNIQYLVGIVANASELGTRAKRLEIARTLNIDDRWHDAWAQSSVRIAFENNQAKFRKFWRDGLGDDVNWKCPESQFLWFDTKRPIDARKVTGKKRFSSMFGAFQEISSEQVERLLTSAEIEGIDSAKGPHLLRNLRSKLEEVDDTVEDDLEEIRKNRTLKQTTRKALIDARCGQGQFRADLLRRWKDKCCVTSCSLGVALRASHIRPWKGSSNLDRLDEENGLLLVATLDALFDRGWITFNDNGTIRISASISREERKGLGLVDLGICIPLTPRQKANLAYHRREKFDKHRTV